MASKQPARSKTQSKTSTVERVAWYALLGVPALVPIAVSKIPLLGMDPLTYNLFVYPKIFVWATLLAVAAVAWAWGVGTGAMRPRTVPLRWWAVAFFALATVSTVAGLSPRTSFFGGRYHAVGLLVFLLGGVTYLLITQLLASTQRVRAFSWSAVAGGSVVAVVGLLQVVGANPLWPDTGPGFIYARGASLLGNPDFTGTYLCVPIVLAAALALGEKAPRDRMLAGVAFVLTTAAMIATLTRGAWIAAAIGLVVLGVLAWRSGARRLSAWGIGAAPAALLVPLLLILREPTRAVRQIADITAGQTGGGGRLILWRDALAVIARHPLFGTGPDAYRLGWYAVRSVAAVKLSGLATTTEDPHNIVLLLSATLGIPAALAAIGFVAASLVTSFRGAFAPQSDPGRLSYGGWWAALAALAVALFFATNTVSVTLLLFACMGVLAAPRSRPAEWQPAVTYSVAGVVAAFGVVAFVIALMTVSADATLMSAQRSPQKAAIAARAARIASWDEEAVSQANLAATEQVLQDIQTGAPQARDDAAQAEARYRATIASNPYEYKNYVGLAYLLTNSAQVLGEDSLNRAITAVDQAPALYPVSAEAAYLKASAQLALGDAAGAVATLQPLWDIDPTYLEPQAVYVQALAAAGQKAEAVKILGHLRTAFPGDPTVDQVARSIESSGGAKP